MTTNKRTQLVEALEEEAIGQLASVRAYRNYAGKDPDYRHRAKIAIGVIGAYVRLRATMANEHSNALIERRLASGLPGGSASRQLPAKT